MNIVVDSDCFILSPVFFC